MMPNSNKKNESKFLSVACPRCRNRQIIFGKSTALVKCYKCNYLLAKSKGGKAKIRAQIKKVLISIIKT